MKMKRRPRGMRGYLLVVGVVLLALFAARLEGVLSGMRTMLFMERWDEKKQTVDLICSEVDAYVKQDDDWLEYDYTADLRDTVRQIDDWPGIFAALYDDEFALLSDRVVMSWERPLDPMQDEAFTSAAAAAERGEVIITYDTGGGMSQIYVYWRWIPTGHYEDKIVFVLGANPAALVGEHSRMMTRWCVELLAVAAAAIIFAGVMYALLPRREGPSDV